MTDAHIAAIVAAVVQQMRADPDMRGPKGDKGETGPQGPPGEMDLTTVNELRGTIADLRARIEELEGSSITVRTVDDQGRIRDQEVVPLGGILNLHHSFSGSNR